MPKRHRQPSLVIDDPSGRRLRVVLSRSAKRVGVAVTTVRWQPFAQVGLSQYQVQTLLEFLTPTDELEDIASVAMSFDDPDEPDAQLHVAWDHRRRRVTVTASTIRHEIPIEASVVLGANDVATLLRWIATDAASGRPSAAG